MLVRDNHMLDVANDNYFAVAAFNISDYSMFNGIMEVAHDLRSPVLIAIHPDEFAHIGGDMLAAIVQKAERSSVPVGIHLDHGASVQQLLAAIQCGFTSGMIDKSMLSFEENVALTKEFVDIAHQVGLGVEAELGTIGKTDNEAEDGAAEIIYTDPEDARAFVAATGCDSLAVAIGTCHGLYPSWMKPELKLDLLREIKKAISIPLVLHGGSNNPDDEIAESVKLGVNKINISSDIKSAYYIKMREVLADDALREPLTIQPPCVEAMKEVAAHKIQLFNSEGKASLY